MYQTSNRRDLPEEWIQWTFYFSMCHDRLNVSPPLRLRLPLCLLEFGKQSAVPYVAEPTNPQCSPESRVKTEPTWTNTSPSFPSAGAPAGPRLGGLWANMEITVGIKECIWQSSAEQLSSFVGKYWRLRWRVIVRERAARDSRTSQRLFDYFLH